MNKKELAIRIAEKTNMKHRDVESVVNRMLEEIETALETGEPVKLFGFGTFRVHNRAGWTGRNPATGEEVTIPSCNVPGFKPGKRLKDRVNQSQQRL